MGLLHEGRLDNTVDAGTIGVGERVEIRTRMGNQHAVGEVIANTPMGIALENGQFYNRDMYLFVPLEESPPVVLSGQLLDTPDDRVAAKLTAMGGNAYVSEADKLGDDDTATPGGGDKDDTGDESDGDDDKDEPPEKKPEPEKLPLAKPDSSVDVDSLPEDIKKAVISTTQMDADELNGVLSEIGDATMKALRRANIRDTDVYGVVSKIQNAVHRILTGKPPAPPAPPKKKKDDK